MKRKISKTRKEVIEWTSVDRVSSLNFEFEPMSESFFLLEADPAKTKLKTLYERESGKDKVLTSIATTSKDSLFNSDATLRNRFDHLIAIDTNTKVHKGNRIAITTAYCVKDCLKDYGSEIPFEHLCSFLISGLEKEEKTEPIGWFLTLKNRINASHFREKTLGVVVDSELGDHEFINSRQKNYYFKYLLPEPFKLIYATDAVVDQLPNQMIRLCDRASNRVFEKIESALDLYLKSAVTPIDGTAATYAEIGLKRPETNA